jgi:hypothetical protein
MFVRIAVVGSSMLVFGLGGAQAFVAAPQPAAVAATMFKPVAMCGYTCRSGGRYIPGPPEVCTRRGMEYCGSSRGGGARVVVPGVGVTVGGGREEYGWRRRRDEGRGGCRTVTIERDDGSVRRIRRCD